MRLSGLLLLGLALVASSAVGARAQEVPDEPLRRWRFFIEQRRFPGTEGLGERLQAARRDALRRPTLRAPSPFAAVTGEVWTPLGPGRIPISGTSTGRVSDVVVHPGDLDVLFIGGAQGGVWRSDDAGGSWRPLTDQECSLAMGSIALDPVNPDIVYAGTGEQHFSGDSYYGCGVLRSTDGGETWTRLGAEMAVGTPTGPRISRVRIDPATAGTTGATVVWAATSNGLFRSTDSGLTWTLTLGGVVTDLVVDPSDPAVLRAGVYADGIHLSVDGGQTWVPEPVGIPSPVGRINLAVAPSDGDVIYAAAADLEEGDLLGIWRTVDGGATWLERTATGASCGFQCWYDLTLAVHPTHPEILYFGGVRLYRSDNGAGTFAAIMGSGPFIHVDQHMITVDARQPDWLWVGNDGGVYHSMDRGSTWTSLNTDLALTQFYGGVSVDPSGVEGVLGGTQDNGTVQYRGSPDWDHVLGGDGGFTAIHPLEDRRWMETQWGGGYSGPRRSDFGGPASQRIDGIDLTDPAIFIPPLVMDPFDPQVLYFGTERLYRTTDGGTTWDIIGTFGGHRLTAIAPSRSDGDVVWAATSRGLVVVTRDGGGTWTEVTSGLPSRYATDLAVHPTEPGTAWVTLSGFGTGHVFRADDFGPSFTDVTGDLPDHPVNAILLDPGDPAQLYIGTDLGVFASNGPGTWVRLGEGLPMVAVFDLATDPAAGIMVAATHGRGAFHLPAEAPLELQLRSTGVSLSRAASEGPLEGTIPVGVYGSGWPTAPWSATVAGGDGWLTLAEDAGTGRGELGWRLDPGELWPGTYEAAVTVALSGAGASLGGGPAPTAGPAGASVDVPFSVAVPATHQAAVGESARTADAELGSEVPVPDSVAVSIIGPSPASAGWSAIVKGGSAWVTLVDGTGTGPGTLRWQADPTGLSLGTYVDTLVVGGPSLATAEVEITLLVSDVFRAALGAGSRLVQVAEGTDEAVPDSLAVTLLGFGAADSAWVATHGGGPWLSLADSTGTGSGTVRWSVDPTGLAQGTYVDTVVVSVAGLAPLRVVDSLSVLPPLTVSAGQPAGIAPTIAGVAESAADSAVIEIEGFGSGDARWVAEVEPGSGVELMRSEGAAGERVVWRRDASALGAGVHVDSLTIRVEDAGGVAVVILQSLRVEPDLSRDDAASELLVGGTLSVGQRDALDALGNGDGAYDVGDFLAWVERCAAGGATCAGSAPGAGAPPAGGGR